jgi:hypothetical protein
MSDEIGQRKPEKREEFGESGAPALAAVGNIAPVPIVLVLDIGHAVQAADKHVTQTVEQNSSTVSATGNLRPPDQSGLKRGSSS